MIQNLTQQLNNDFETNGNPEILCGKIIIYTDPSLGLNFTKKQLMFDTNDSQIRYSYPFQEKDSETIYAFFKEYASRRIANKLEFIIENRQVTQVNEYWDEQIIEDFNNNLPKSKRGKIKAWYDNEEVWEQYLQKQKKL